MDKKLLLLGGIVGVMSSGCAVVTQSPVSGGLFVSTKGAISANGATGAKKGEACAMSILGIVGIGDASTAAAMQKGGISNVKTVDSDNFSVLGIYASSCTVVTGE